MDGLSLMSHEVWGDGTIVDMKGHRSNIFQPECKIQDKVCKLIIDGGSLTNAISSDLVHALSLSTWTLHIQPCKATRNSPFFLVYGLEVILLAVIM